MKDISILRPVEEGDSYTGDSYTGGKLHGDSLPQVILNTPVDGGVLNPQRK
ncbi:MAG: hypothetical protein F6K18_29290 [Okeania sp. SIO2C2]|uniref:hypothetical protein n=1 Tax=Okeania sp. SIO2C2 TaxID=2607787 RepID=UPI0013B8140C|nr:hypothetical protein [Okeania sp. SIO2C2]NEP90582.1 hypothetical protein [Okeania sp. SIO2C2]